MNTLLKWTAALAGAIAVLTAHASLLGVRDESSAVLPESYTELDWIESDGNCGIVTDYFWNGDGVRVEIDAMWNANGGYWQSLVCATSDNTDAANASGYCFAVSKPYAGSSQPLWFWWDDGIWNAVDRNSVSLTQFHKVVAYKSSTSVYDTGFKIIVDGASKTTTNTGWNPISKKPPVYPLTFFCRLPVGYQTPTQYFDIAKLRRMKIYSSHEGGDVLADFVPVLQNGTGAVGLLDCVSAKFYVKVGNGVFGYAYK